VIAIIAYVWNQKEIQMEIAGFEIEYPSGDNNKLTILRDGEHETQKISLSYNIMIKNTALFKNVIHGDEDSSYTVHLSTAEVRALELKLVENQKDYHLYKSYTEETAVEQPKIASPEHTTRSTGYMWGTIFMTEEDDSEFFEIDESLLSGKFPDKKPLNATPNVPTVLKGGSQTVPYAASEDGAPDPKRFKASQESPRLKKTPFQDITNLHNDHYGSKLPLPANKTLSDPNLVTFDHENWEAKELPLLGEGNLLDTNPAFSNYEA